MQYFNFCRVSWLSKFHFQISQKMNYELFFTSAGIMTNEVFTFGEWINIANIKNHSFPHVFKLTLGQDGKTVIQYKKWTTDKVIH